MNEGKRERMRALDGLRGIAIILVVLNHLRLWHLYDVFPALFHPFLSSLLNSGKVGVGILFLLSGFLMARFYPTVPDIGVFWQKRYTRIIPAFFVMCAALTCIRFFWIHLSPLHILGILVSFMGTGGLVWRTLRKHPHRRQIGTMLFRVSIIAQIVILIGYLAIQISVPPAVFFISWPVWLQYVVTFLTNVAMVHPFGTYIAPLDGAYWSVLTEMSFYILYPILFLPIIGYVIRKRSSYFTLLCILLCFPFCYAIYMVFSSILLFELFNMYLVIYFISGLAIGLLHQTPEIFRPISTITRRIPHWVIPPVAFIMIVGLPYVRDVLGMGVATDLLLWVIPLSFLFVITICHTSRSWSRILENSVLVGLGQISFSLYLVHTISIEMLVKQGDPHTIPEMATTALLSLTVMFGLAHILYYFLERPYFIDKLPVLSHTIDTPRSVSVIRPIQISIGVLFLLIWYAYRVPAPLTSRVTSHTYSYPPYIPITQQPVQFTFTGQHPNLGLIMLHIKTLDDGQVQSLGLSRGSDAQESFTAQFQDQSGQIISSNSYALHQMHESMYHAIGMPVQPDSQNKTYTISFSSPDSALHKVAIVHDDVLFRSVYMQSKHDLLTHPKRLLSTGIEKLTQPFGESDASRVLLLSLPLWCVLLIRSTIEKRGRIHHNHL